MSKTKTKLKTEIENLNFVIEQKDKTIQMLKNTCWELINKENQENQNTRHASLIFWAGFSLGFLVNSLFVAAMMWFVRG